MEWPDDLAAAFPAPREDEPPDLRRKIIAELRDHLHTATQRELLVTGNAELAQRNVLARFGDPARLARKLWYEAMWEKIMSQRMMLAAMAVVVLVSVGSLGLTAYLVAQAGNVSQALLEQNRATNEILLTKLAALNQPAGDAGKTMEWNTLRVRLSYEQLGGAPAAGFKVALQGRIFDAGSPGALERTTGPDGIADFGLVRPGQHLLDVVTPWGETIDNTSMTGWLVPATGLMVTVPPGEPQAVEIVCPTQPEEAEIAVEVHWPSNLAGQPLWLVCDFVLSPREIGGRSWIRDEDKSSKFIVVSAAGRLMNPGMDGMGSSFFGSPTGFYLQEEVRYYANDSKTFVDGPGIYGYARSPGFDPNGPRMQIWIPKTDAVARLKWPAGRYSVTHIAVGRESESDQESDQKSLPDDLWHPVFLGSATFNRDDPSQFQLVYPNEQRGKAHRRQRQTIKIEDPQFEAVAGSENNWRLSLPEPLVEMLMIPESEAEAAAPAPKAARAAAPASTVSPSTDDDDR